LQLDEKLILFILKATRDEQIPKSIHFGIFKLVGKLI